MTSPDPQVVRRRFGNLTFATCAKSYNASDQYSIATIHLPCVFLGKMLRVVEVRCQLVAVKDAFE